MGKVVDFQQALENAKIAEDKAEAEATTALEKLFDATMTLGTALSIRGMLGTPLTPEEHNFVEALADYIKSVALRQESEK